LTCCEQEHGVPIAKEEFRIGEGDVMNNVIRASQLTSCEPKKTAAVLSDKNAFENAMEGDASVDGIAQAIEIKISDIRCFGIAWLIFGQIQWMAT
jgi:hypothetical protein